MGCQWLVGVVIGGVVVGVGEVAGVVEVVVVRVVVAAVRTGSLARSSKAARVEESLDLWSRREPAVVFSLFSLAMGV